MPTRRSNARRRAARRTHTRRGVVSVLAMMFLVLFGSLVAAMAIASRGNIRTASTQLQVMQALGAAETGLIVAQNRLAMSTSRFVVEESDMTPDFVQALWLGSMGGHGTYTVLPDPEGYDDSPDGVAEALLFLHSLDANIIVESESDLSAPAMTAAWPDADPDVYKSEDWVVTPIVAIDAPSESGPPPAGYQVIYAPLQNGTDIRVIVIGYDFQENRPPMTRTIMQDFRIAKQLNQAVVSPSRILIGKNVQVVGDLGARFDAVDFAHGDPLLTKSDFANISQVLDSKLEAFYAVAGDPAIDVDGDNRLRPDHPIEGPNIPESYGLDGGDPDPSSAFADATGDGYVDEFDIFINNFDENGDKRVEIDTEFVDGEGKVIDADLAYLIDSGTPDRNRNGVYGFNDINKNGRYDPDIGEEFLDWFWYTDSSGNTTKHFPDHELGYLDGYLDLMDRYVKLNGRLVFGVSESAWAAANPDYNEAISGAIRPSNGDAPRLFEATEQDLPLITADSFSASENEIQIAADGDDFWQQVADNLGLGVGDLVAYDEPHDSGDYYLDEKGNEIFYPRYLRLDPDANLDGLPDNWDSAYFEAMPFNSPSPVDWYYRPVFEHMVFRDAVIPEGLNGLFIDCTFVGATYVRAHVDNFNVLDPDKAQISWNEYGKLVFDTSSGRPKPARSRFIFGDDSSEYNVATGDCDCPPLDDSVLPPEARPPNQLLLMADTPMDKGDIPASQVGSFAAADYDALPDPLIIEAVRDIGSGPELVPTRVSDTREYSNNDRFHDCLFVGSIVSDVPQQYTHVRNKMQFTGKTRFLSEHPTDESLNPDEEDMAALAKSSMMLPNFSVDVGTFNSPPEQEVKLHGTIVAGVLDVRGNAEIEGSLLLTFQPVYGEGPLKDLSGNAIGNPADFNASLGYFGPEDGDEESFDPWTLPVVDGVRIVGWDLDGDGIADLGPDESPTQEQLDAGAEVVPFNGFGRIRLNFNPETALPDGLMLPVQIVPLHATYKEGKL
ncbi:MAG: hypothetical protein IPJ41_09510 [Phycisphaerales bacterium]|nr:hypothetical protein [Phycisphaerales bacterium]